MKTYILKPVLRLLYLLGGLAVIPAMFYFIITGEDYRELLEDIDYL